MEAIMEVKDVRASYGKFNVLHDLSFSVREKEILGVIGPNGAGKTTLMNVIIGRLLPERGEILFRGEDITKLPDYRRCRMGIGRTYQVPKPFDGMTVFENTLVGAIYGANKRERTVRENCLQILNMTGLYEKRNRPAGKLELLDRKRMEIARALATEPKLLLLDEVAAGLSEYEVAYIIRLVRELREMGITIIWIEHIIKTMVEATDTLLCLSEGTKLAMGKPAEVIASKAVEEVYLGADEVEQSA